MTENPETTEELLDKYPEIFELYHKRDEIEGPVPPIVFGLSIPDAWVPLVDELCDDLQELDPDIVAHQVKSKFGGLRFYTGGTSEEALDRIREAADKSFNICQQCGGEGERVGQAYVNTLCDECAAERERERMERYRGMPDGDAE